MCAPARLPPWSPCGVHVPRRQLVGPTCLPRCSQASPRGRPTWAPPQAMQHADWLAPGPPKRAPRPGPGSVKTPTIGPRFSPPQGSCAPQRRPPVPGCKPPNWRLPGIIPSSRVDPGCNVDHNRLQILRGPGCRSFPWGRSASKTLLWSSNTAEVLSCQYEVFRDRCDARIMSLQQLMQIRIPSRFHFDTTGCKGDVY